jgi:hypothetical protein
MMLNLIDVDKNKISQPVVEFLSMLELKHAKNPTIIDVRAAQSVTREEFWQLRFADPRFTEQEMPLIGVAEWTYGTRSNKEYKISSRRIQNDRFSGWSNENSSRRTKDVKKAVKIAVESLAPYMWHEVSAKGRRDAEGKHKGWVSECNQAVRPFTIDNSVIYEELKHLVEQGVVFKTEEFKRAAAGIPAYEEFVARVQKPVKFDTIIERGDKVIYIKDGRALEAQELGAVDSLPENTRNSIALLKLVGKDSLLPEVGYRAGENTYFIYA